MSWLKRRLPKKRWKRVLLYFVSVLLILLAGDMALVQYWRHIDISYDTTRVTSPLTDRGMPDYLAAMNAEESQGVTADNNAAPLLIEIFGTKDMAPKWRDSVQTALGMPTGEHSPLMVKLVDLRLKRQAATQPGTMPTAESASPEMDQKAFELELHLEKTFWRSADEPEGAAWMAANEKALTLMHEAVSRPRYWVPLRTPSSGVSNEELLGAVLSLQMPLLNRIGSLNRLAMARAMQQLGDHDIEGFQQDIIDTMKLSRLIAQKTTIVELLLSYGQEVSSAHAIQRASTSGMLTETQAQELLQRLDALPPLPGLSYTIDVDERYFMLDQFCILADQGSGEARALFDGSDPDESPFGSKLSAWLGPVHYNKTMRQLNHYYDLIRDGTAQERYADRVIAMDAIENELNNRGRLAKLTDLSGMLASILLPSLGTVEKLHEQAVVEYDLARVSLELAIHKARSGEYPETLAALVPAECSTVPLDGFVDKPLIYRRQGAGYLLYSVGPDGQDDGGIPRDQAKDGHYDIVVRAEK